MIEYLYSFHSISLKHIRSLVYECEVLLYYAYIYYELFHYLHQNIDKMLIVPYNLMQHKKKEIILYYVKSTNKAYCFVTVRRGINKN